MRVRVGIDIIEVERIAAAIARHGERFLARVFTPAEARCCRGRVASLAARFAAKEAAAKALGQGIDNVRWHDIEVLNDADGRPILHLHGEARYLAARAGLNAWDVSLSHARDYAVASVVAYHLEQETAL